MDVSLGGVSTELTEAGVGCIPPGDICSSFIFPASVFSLNTRESVSSCRTVWGGVAKGWQISIDKDEESRVDFSNQFWIERGSVVKIEASSRDFKRMSAFSIASSERGARKDSMPSNFSIEEMAWSSPAVAFDEEGSHSLPLRFWAVKQLCWPWGRQR